MKRKWHICPACQGEGTCVNPAIDSHGISSAEFYEDPDFAEEYFSGTFDVPCGCCKGTGKITEERLEERLQAAEDRRLRAAEDGDWESYNTAYDLRWE